MIKEVLPMLLGTPYQFQIESAEVLWDARYGLSADEMGLGKSLEAIICTVAHMVERPGAKIIVCVPAFLKANWDREFNKFTIHVRTKTCFSANDIPEKWGDFDVVIMNYEQLEKTRHLFRKATMVVADEIHYCKNHNSSRTKFFSNYLHDYRPERVILLSGTPIKNRVHEYFSIIKILDLNQKWYGHRLALNRYVQFCDHFCYREERRIPGRRFAEVKWIGFKNEDDFFNLLNGRYIRHMAKDVIELPPIVHQDVITKRFPETGEDPLEGELRNMWEMYLMGIESQFLASRKVESALLKVPYTIQVVEDLLSSGNGPIVVFTDHINSAKVMGEKWKKNGFAIMGTTTIPLRDKIVQMFQNGEIDVLVATIGTMSAGWTLTNACRVVFNDLPWVPGDFAQAIKRVHRIGQGKKCFVYNIVTTELDKMIMGTLREKTQVLNSVLKQTH